MVQEVLEEKVERLEIRANDHGKRIKILENRDAAQEVKIENLCDKLEKQTAAIYWLVGTILIGLAGFAIYALRIAVFYTGG